MEKLLESLSLTVLAVAIVAVLLVIVGMYVVRYLKPENPMAPYALQILGLTFILPVVLLMSVSLALNNEAVMALLGTIVGYIFGTSGVTTARIDLKKSEAKADQSEQ